MGLDYCGIPTCPLLEFAALRSLTVPEPLHIFYWCHWPRHQEPDKPGGLGSVILSGEDCAIPWNCFLWLKRRSDKIELFGDKSKETPLGACGQSPSTAIWVLSERRKKTSQSCNSGPSQRQEQTYRKHPWPIGAAAALRSKTISMDVWPCHCCSNIPVM